ncbi:MAG TPA: haloacid dehalogenase type II [Hyphomicrobiaceae bacterium]|nr:haloacid dehalogenase type II [Hyphomicrobiaceae bacterium]
MPLYVFDAYGTLFDVHAAAERQKDSIGPKWKELSQIWRTKHLEYTWVYSLAGRQGMFWMLAQRSLDYAIAQVGGGISGDARARLLASYRAMAIYPEVGDVLGALKARGDKLAILSNGDADMLTDAVRAAKLEGIFDAVISVVSAGIFKPSPKVYQLVASRFSEMPPTEVSFQSSNRWDIAGAKAFGFRCVWINRMNAPDEYPDLPPDRTVRDLRGLLE